MKHLIAYLKAIHFLHSWGSWMKDGSPYTLRYFHNREFWWEEQVMVRFCAKCSDMQSKKVRLG